MSRNEHLSKFKMAAAAIFNFEKLLPFLAIGSTLTKFGGNVANLINCATVMSKNAHLTRFKMAAAAILNFERLFPIHYFWPILTKLIGNVSESDVERICHVETQHNGQNSRWQLPPYLMSKSSCHFFIIRPTHTKFGEHVGTPM